MGSKRTETQKKSDAKAGVAIKSIKMKKEAIVAFEQAARESGLTQGMFLAHLVQFYLEHHK